MNILPKSGKKLAVYLINLDRAADRLTDMNSRLSALSLDYQRVPAVDGNEARPKPSEFSRISYMLLHGRRPIPAEIGCYLSHVDCAKRFLEADADIALILEDDVVFNGDFVEAIDAAVTFSREWDILRLTTVNKGKKFRIKKISSNYWLSIALTREKGAGAYLVNKKAAQWISKSLLPMRLSYDIAFDLEYLAGLKALFLDPLPANQVTGYETQIQKNIKKYKLPRVRYLTVLPYRTYLELLRVTVRGARLAMSLMRG